MSGVVCIKLNLSKFLACLEYKFFEQYEEGEKEVIYMWKAKIFH